MFVQADSTNTFPTAEYHCGKSFMLQPILLPEIEVGMALQRDIRNWWAVLTSSNTMHTLAVTYFQQLWGTLIHFFFIFNYSHCEFQAISLVHMIVFTSLVLTDVYATLWSTGFCSRMTQPRHQTIMAITLFGGVLWLYYYCCCWKSLH